MHTGFKNVREKVSNLCAPLVIADNRLISAGHGVDPNAHGDQADIDPEQPLCLFWPTGCGWPLLSRVQLPFQMVPEVFKRGAISIIIFGLNQSLANADFECMEKNGHEIPTSAYSFIHLYLNLYLRFFCGSVNKHINLYVHAYTQINTYIHNIIHTVFTNNCHL